LPLSLLGLIVTTLQIVLPLGLLNPLPIALQPSPTIVLTTSLVVVFMLIGPCCAMFEIMC